MFRDLVTNNRSYRRYDESHKISMKEIQELIELARLCPSAANLQSLRYYIVSSEEQSEAIFPHLRWANYLRNWDGPQPGERPSAYIIILTPLSTGKFHHLDTGIVAQTILLGATEKGFGGCMLASVDKDAIHAVLDIPEDLEVALVISLGVPAEKVVIDEVIDPDDIEYWRDDEGIHHVPKRSMYELLINP